MSAKGPRKNDCYCTCSDGTKCFKTLPPKEDSENPGNHKVLICRCDEVKIFVCKHQINLICDLMFKPARFISSYFKNYLAYPQNSQIKSVEIYSRPENAPKD